MFLAFWVWGYVVFPSHHTHHIYHQDTHEISQDIVEQLRTFPAILPQVVDSFTEFFPQKPQPKEASGLLKTLKMEIPWNPWYKLVSPVSTPKIIFGAYLDTICLGWCFMDDPEIPAHGVPMGAKFVWSVDLDFRNSPEKNSRFCKEFLCSMKHHHHHHHATKDTKISSAGHCNFYLVFVEPKKINMFPSGWQNTPAIRKANSRVDLLATQPL